MSDQDVLVSVPQVSLSVEYQLIEVCLEGPVAIASDVGPHTALFSTDPTQMCVEATEATEVVVAPTHALSTVVGAQGPAGASGTGLEAVYLPGFDTSLVTAGRFVYTSDDFLVEHADSATLPKASALGVFDGQWGRVLAFGIATVAFTSGSAVPSPGDSVFLARADSEAGAAGKGTATCPLTGFASPVGYVVSVPANFTTARTAQVHVRVQNFARWAS